MMNNINTKNLMIYRDGYEASWSCPQSCTSEGRCLALVSEVSNDTVSPRLVCLAIHSVTYKYIAQDEMHAFRTLRSPCHQRPQRPPCSIGCCVPNRRRVSKRRYRIPQRHRCVSKRRHVTHHRGVTNGLCVTNGCRVTQCCHVTHYRVSLMVSVSLNTAASPTTGCH